MSRISFGNFPFYIIKQFFYGALVLLTVICLFTNKKSLQTNIFNASLNFMNTKNSLKDQKLNADSTLREIPMVNPIAKIWPEDEICNDLWVGFGKNIPLQFLLSHPRSGSHWVLYLISSATGIYGTVSANKFSKEEIKEGYLGFLKPWDSLQTIITRAHFVNANNLGANRELRKNPSIFLVRNPMRLILSEWDYEVGGPLSNNVRGRYDSKGFNKVFRNHLALWREMYVNYLSVCTTRFLVIFYENVKEEPLREIKKIVNFLNVRENPKRMNCIQRHVEGKFKRNVTISYPYTVQSHIDAGLSAVRDFISVLKSKNISYPTSYDDFVNKSIY